MKNLIRVLAAVVICITALGLVSLVLTRPALNASAASSPQQVDILDGLSDSNPTQPSQVIIPAEYQVNGLNSPQAIQVVVPTPEPSAKVYFTPQDENTTNTILNVYNTNGYTSTVNMKTFYINGSLSISTSFKIPPHNLLRISGDSVSTISASWQKTLLINFTTFSAYAEMKVPLGVKIDGYITGNAKGVYDPLVVTNTLPLRFSTDPFTVFIPTVK